MHKHKLNKRNKLKQKLKAEKRKRSLKECLKAKTHRLDFLPFPSIKSITIQKNSDQQS